MILISFVLGFVGLCGQAYLSYEPTTQNKWYYYPLGVGLNALGALLWFYIAKITAGKQTLMAAMLWDGMAAVAFFLLPLLAFNIKLNSMNMLGLCFGAVGLILMKLGG